MNPAGLRRLSPALAAGVIIVVASTLTRLALAFRPEVAALPWLELARSFALGLVFDMAAAFYLVLPFALWLSFLPNRFSRNGFFRILKILAFLVLCFTALFLSVAEWIFWDEFGARFNFIAVDYLLYSQEVIGNIWESYPTGKLLIGLALLAAVLTTLFARAIWRWSGILMTWRTGVMAAVALLAVFTALTAGLNHEMKLYSDKDSANELAGNGVYEFFAALRQNELSFDRYYANLPDAEALALVRADIGDKHWIAPLSQGVERYENGRGVERRLNVILVSIESLGAEFIGAYGDPRGLTPNLDRLAKESLWFSRLYATGNRTVRGLEALSLALPPTPGQSIVRRPKNEHLFSLGSVFSDKGYGVSFAYGGYGYFDNMNAFFGTNGYRVTDRKDIPDSRIEFQNIWGVADEHLYDHVIETIDREKQAHPDQPVFTHVMTTSNHRPYTYPPGRIDIPSGSGRDGAVKYTDFAVGQFLERARARPWFKDTVFVITADHGASARGTAQIPLDKYLIPAFIYSPENIKPERVDRLMSQIDIAPTILGLLDLHYFSKFLGRDILHSPPESDRAFVANFQTLGYMKGNTIAVLQPKRQTDVYRIEKGAYQPMAAGGEQLLREASAFYQVASHLFRDRLYGNEAQRSSEERIALGGQPKVPAAGEAAH